MLFNILTEDLLILSSDLGSVLKDLFSGKPLSEVVDKMNIHGKDLEELLNAIEYLSKNRWIVIECVDSSAESDQGL